MFCSNCGTQRVEGNAFCQKCGTRAGEVKRQVPVSTPVPINNQPQPIVIRERGGSSGLVKILLLVVVAGGAVYFFGDALGLTQECATPFCRNSAQFMRDFCADCRDTIDRANNILDRARRFF